MPKNNKKVFTNTKNGIKTNFRFLFYLKIKIIYNQNMKTYLITGGYGFIGSNYILKMIENPENYIINLDKLTYASNLKYLEKIEDYDNYLFINGDICDEKLVDEIFKTFNIDYVVHFAAESHVDRSYEYKLDFVKTNIYGTINLLDTIKKYWKNKEEKRFIHISTDEIYGSSISENSELKKTKKYNKENLKNSLENIKTKEFYEFEKPNPSSPYSYTKTVADLIAIHYANIYDLPIIVARPTNNYGINQHPEKLIPKTLLACFNNKPITIHGSGEQLRDFLNVNDNINAINLLIEKGEIGGTYNVCAKNEVSVLQVVKLITNYYKTKIDPNFVPKIEYIEDRPNQDLRYFLNCDKIKNLGFTINTNFETELENVLDYYIENIDLLINAKY